jgi:hypothetical protein
LTSKDVDDGAEVGPLLDQVAGSLSSFTADGAYDQDDVGAAIGARRVALASCNAEVVSSISC